MPRKQTKEDAIDLSETYLHIEKRKATALPVDDTFWSEIAGRKELQPGWLMGMFHVTESPNGKEMHPLGDEILLLVSGAMDVILELPEGDKVIPLRAGGACLVPKGVWHRQRIKEPTTMVFLTAGEGTQHGE
jgi:mannose-6-phosphate isomerase-like protein (cupin superfamily)